MAIVPLSHYGQCWGCNKIYFFQYTKNGKSWECPKCHCGISNPHDVESEKLYKKIPKGTVQSTLVFGKKRQPKSKKKPTPKPKKKTSKPKKKKQTVKPKKKKAESKPKKKKQTSKPKKKAESKSGKLPDWPCPHCKKKARVSTGDYTKGGPNFLYWDCKPCKAGGTVLDPKAFCVCGHSYRLHIGDIVTCISGCDCTGFSDKRCELGL